MFDEVRGIPLISLWALRVNLRCVLSVCCAWLRKITIGKERQPISSRIRAVENFALQL